MFVKAEEDEVEDEGVEEDEGVVEDEPISEDEEVIWRFFSAKFFKNDIEIQGKPLKKSILYLSSHFWKI